MSDLTDRILADARLDGKPMRGVWDAAEAEPGTKIPVGDLVVCDFCDEDYTQSSAEGGFIFGSKAVCPNCAERLGHLAMKHGELKYIRARCPEGVSFADFVRGYRGPDAFVLVQIGGLPKGTKGSGKGDIA